MPHGKNCFQTASDMVMAKICTYPSSNYALPHWIFVLRCCVQCPWIDHPSPESDKHNSTFIPRICFRVYQHITRFTVYFRLPLNENKQCQLCESSTYSIINAKHYTIKELVAIDTSIVDFRQQFYIPAMHNISFHLQHVHILVTRHYVNTR